MKRAPLLMVFVIAAVLLSACASRSSSTSSSSGVGSGSRRNFTLTSGTKLAIGIIKLEGTPQAIDATMAAKLLPLWQLMLQLDGSATAAPQEVAAVEDQIQATLTPAQANAISGMKISQADMLSVFQTQGAAAAGGTTSARTAGGNAGGGDAFVGGGFGGGGFPGGGFGGGGTRPAGGTTSGATTGSTTARSQTSVAVPAILVNQVISLLQSKITS